MVSGFTYASNQAFVMTGNGDIYARGMDDNGIAALRYFGNFWSGTGSVNAQPHTLGQLKARSRNRRRPAAIRPPSRLPCRLAQA